MSTRTQYVCDHCGAECTNKFELSLSGYAMEPGRFTTISIHGCAREHTILAIAKILGIGVDGKAAELLAAKDREIERQHGVIRSQNNDIARMQERIAVLKSRPDVAEVLQRVRSKLNEAERLDASDDEGHVYVIRIGDAIETIDAETDSLTGPKKPTKPGGES